MYKNNSKGLQAQSHYLSLYFIVFLNKNVFKAKLKTYKQMTLLVEDV